jgi:transporter family protein
VSTTRSRRFAAGRCSSSRCRGLATGVSWLAYFRALQLAPASRVAPIDKLSLALTIALAALVLGESVSWKVALGATLMVIGSLLTLSN